MRQKNFNSSDEQLWLFLLFRKIALIWLSRIDWEILRVKRWCYSSVTSAICIPTVSMRGDREEVIKHKYSDLAKPWLVGLWIQISGICISRIDMVLHAGALEHRINVLRRPSNKLWIIYVLIYLKLYLSIYYKTHGPMVCSCIHNTCVTSEKMTLIHHESSKNDLKVLPTMNS